MTVKELIDSNEVMERTFQVMGHVDSDYHGNSYVWQNFWIQDENDVILYQGVYSGIPKSILAMTPISDLSKVKTMIAAKINNTDCVLGTIFNRITVKSK